MSLITDFCNKVPLLQDCDPAFKKNTCAVSKASWLVVGLLMLIFGSLALAHHSTFAGIGTVGGAVMFSIGAVLTIALSGIGMVERHRAVNYRQNLVSSEER